MKRGIRKWYADTREAFGRGPVAGLLHGLYYAYVGLWLTVTSRVPIGTHVYDQDWDLLIVLDACRVDALATVAEEYDILGDLGSVASIGSTSSEWLAHTFDGSYRDEIAETAYVTANPHSDAVLRNDNMPPQYFASPVTWPAWNTVDPSAFGDLVEVWQTDFSERLDVTPPRATTDRAIEVAREGQTDRLIVHYMQPHAPYVEGYGDAEERPPEERRKPFEHLRSGRLSQEDAWAAYLDNLRLVLDEVDLLCNNVDGDVVITADHGEAFGELSFYEHPVGCPHPVVKMVPWVETTATDRKTHSPPEESEHESAEASVDQQLRALGYT